MNSAERAQECCADDDAAAVKLGFSGVHAAAPCLPEQLPATVRKLASSLAVPLSPMQAVVLSNQKLQGCLWLAETGWL